MSLSVHPGAAPPDGLGPYLRSTLGSAADNDEDAELERWLNRNCLRLADLDKAIVGDIARELTRRLNGEPLAPTTVARYRTNARACIRAAVDAGAMAAEIRGQPPREPAPAAR